MTCQEIGICLTSLKYEGGKLVDIDIIFFYHMFKCSINYNIFRNAFDQEWNEKRKKQLWVFVYIKYGKFWSVSPRHFIKHKPFFSEECIRKRTWIYGNPNFLNCNVFCILVCIKWQHLAFVWVYNPLHNYKTKVELIWEPALN